MSRGRQRPLFGVQIAPYERRFPSRGPKRRKPGLVHVIAHVRAIMAGKFRKGR